MTIRMPGPVHAPMDNFVLLARWVPYQSGSDDELPPLLRYDRGEPGSDGRWCYHYVGTEPVPALATSYQWQHTDGRPQ